MKIRFQNSTSGERIRHLMDNKNIKNAPALVREMVENGILDKKKFEGDFLRYTADTINKHLTDKQLPDRKWLDLYCDFFDCSSDYLMGYIDYPTHSTTNICQSTGLSEKATEKITRWNQVAGGKLCSLLSEIIENPLFDEIMIDYVTSLMGYSDGTNPDNQGSNGLKSRVTFMYMIQQTFTQIIKEMSDKRMSAE